MLPIQLLKTFVTYQKEKDGQDKKDPNASRNWSFLATHIVLFLQKYILNPILIGLILYGRDVLGGDGYGVRVCIAFSSAVSFAFGSEELAVKVLCQEILGTSFSMASCSVEKMIVSSAYKTSSKSNPGGLEARVAYRRYVQVGSGPRQGLPQSLFPLHVTNHLSITPHILHH